MKSRKKLNSNKILLKICVIIMLFLGTGYSLLSQDLSISGSVTIPAKENTTLDGTVKYSSGVFSRYILITITNNNSFEVSSWSAEIYISTLSSESELSSNTLLALINGATALTPSECTIDLTNKKIIFSKNVILSANGGSAKYLIGYSGSKPTCSIYAYEDNNVVTADTQTAIVAANREQVTSYSSDLEGFVYTEKNVDIVVNYENVNRNDGKYETNVILNISNYENVDISNLEFNILYINQIEDYNNISTYSLLQSDSTEKKSSYKLYEKSVIKPNETMICKINGFVTNEQFEGIQINGLKYEATGKLDTSNFENTIGNEISNTIIENNINENVIKNEITNEDLIEQKDTNEIYFNETLDNNVISY